MINLLPGSFRRQQLIRIRAIQWSTIICAVIAVGWGWTWLEEGEAVALTQQLASLEREHAPSKTMMRQLVEMREKLDELQQQEAVAMELEYHRNALTLLGVISSTAKATNGRVRVTHLTLTGFQNVRQPQAGETPQQTSEGLLVKGISLDNAAVVEMLDGLQNSGVFSRVELLVSKERSDGAGALRDYEVRCEF
jgi:Tfp pilus assembly protein PilN